MAKNVGSHQKENSKTLDDDVKTEGTRNERTLTNHQRKSLIWIINYTSDANDIESTKKKTSNKYHPIKRHRTFKVNRRQKKSLCLKRHLKLWTIE